MKKQIEVVQTDNGLVYFPIYEVICETYSGEEIEYAKYLKKDDAIETKRLLEKDFTDRYAHIFINKELVWVE